MKKKSEFTIGDSVKVMAMCRFYHSEESIAGRVRLLRKFFVENLETTFSAKITGFKYGFLGEIMRGESYGFDPEEYNPAYLQTEATVGVWLVRRGLMNKEIMVPDGYLSKIDDFDFPVKWSDKSPVSEKDKEMLREEMKKIPRNKKGQWIRPTSPVQLPLF